MLIQYVIAHSVLPFKALLSNPYLTLIKSYRQGEMKFVSAQLEQESIQEIKTPEPFVDVLLMNVYTQTMYSD